jgi:tRNA 2-selenouridine synthase
VISSLSDAHPAALAGFDAIIDVRSPAEFAEDHVPGAINLPVLDDEERSRVGTIYVQESRFLARRIGAALVARNIARHLEDALADRSGAFAPLVYCWRGGQRSGAMATVMDQVGWRVSVLAGGYRTYRRRVTAALYDAEPSHRAILLDGPTGVAKTDILARLGARGVQVLDLEGLAAHRGSLFGAFHEAAQPPQKRFESALLAAIEALDARRPVVIEAESSKVGDLNLPPMLWKAMVAAPRIVLHAPREARAAYLVEAYGDIVQDPRRLEEILERLPPHHGRERQATWCALAAAGDHLGLAASLIEAHYDPGYARSSRRAAHRLLGEVMLPDLTPASREAAADRVVALLQTEFPCKTISEQPRA